MGFFYVLFYLSSTLALSHTQSPHSAPPLLFAFDIWIFSVVHFIKVLVLPFLASVTVTNASLRNRQFYVTNYFVPVTPIPLHPIRVIPFMLILSISSANLT